MIIRAFLLMSSLWLIAATPLGAAESTAGAERGQAGSPPGLVRTIKVLPDKAPDCTSLKSIAESVTHGCRSNDEKAIAIYNFMILAHYHRAYPGEAGGLPVLKEINTYGWSLCGGLHSEQSALWRELGWEWRFVGWDGHTTVEARYDGRWHYLDAFLKFYAWMPDASAPGGRTIASQDDLNKDSQALIADVFVLDPGRKAVYARDNAFELFGEKANWMAPAMLTCGDTIQDVINGLKTHKPAGSPAGWSGIEHASGTYSAEVNLAPGFSLTNSWEPLAEDGWYWGGSKIAPSHTCGNKDLRNDAGFGMVLEPYAQRVRGFANGTLRFVPDFASADMLQSFAAVENAAYENGMLRVRQPGATGSVTVLLQSPYVMTKGSGVAEGAEAMEISTDGGKTYKPAKMEDFTTAVKGQVSALARVRFKESLRSLRLEAMVQNNPGSLPYLSPGKNVVTVSVADPGALGNNKLVVTYAYAPGYRNKSPEQLCIEGAEIAKQHGAVWSERPTVVQRVFAAKDLPATFDIDVPTPQGKHPVYPRMLFVRREVIAADSKPVPLPANAEQPGMKPGDELKTLPNPFLVGSQPPPARIVRPIRTTTVELASGQFISQSGATPTTDFLKWPKNAQEKVEPVALLVGGTLPPLPPLKDLAGARLVFPVVRSHPKAPGKVGVAALKSRFVSGRKYDFAQIEDVVGTVVVPALAEDAPDWAPAKQFKVDVTRTLRTVLAGGAPFQGFALRMVPDRGIDDGWTVRVHLPRSPRIYLEIDAYTDERAQ